MKVISIKEPFATLIMNGSKLIETRSWKTNYRGELYIHASGKSLAKEYLKNPYVLELIKDMDMNYGNIICKGNLVDCICMCLFLGFSILCIDQYNCFYDNTILF